MKTLLVFVLKLVLVSSATYTRQSCSTSQIFDTTTLSCVSCPANMRPNPNQAFATSCICNKGYYPTSATTCAYLGTPSSIPCDKNQFYNVVTNQGVYSAGASSNTCSPCDTKAYANINGTGCTPCFRNMEYRLNEDRCVCITSGSTVYTETSRGCFDSTELSSTNYLISSSSKYYNSIKYLLPSCAHFNDLVSCSELVNLCTYSMGHGDSTNEPECKFFTNQSFQYMYEFNTQTDQFYISPGKFSKNQQIKVKLLLYLPTGNFVQEKQMKLPDLLRCGMPSDNSISIKLGNNIQVSCSFDFTYLVQQSQSATYQSYMYEMFIAGQNNNYYPVAVYIGSSTKPVKRFFLEDTFTNPTYMNVINSFKLTFSLNTTGYLVSPALKLAYKKLYIQGSQITPTTDKDQILSYEIKFVYDLQTFWPAFIGIFIAINVLVLIQSFVRTYIAYLNRQSVLNFFYYLMNFWSLWMFYFLIAISGYWFFFCKTTQDVYIFIPDSGTDIFYVAFFVIAGIMGLFRVITVFIDKRFKLNYQIFLINWQKTDNSWRQIFIVNSLAEFYTHRTISFFWMLLTVLFFLTGLSWQSHAAEVAHTTLTSIYYFNPVNRVFLYFLGSSVFLVIGIAFKFLRRVSVVKWPYPFEDFADYCNICNISLFFMKKRQTQAYYMHSEITRHVEVSFNQLNAVIRERQNKGKGIMNEYSFNPGQSMYIIYTCKDLQQKFANMIKRTEQDHKDQLVSISKKNQKRGLNKLPNLRERFIDTELKPYLQDTVKTQSKPDRTLFRRMFGMPEVDLRDQKLPRKKNLIYKDDYLDIVSEVFPNGNQFEQIHTIIILFLMFLLITANACASALISYFIAEYILDKWISMSCRSRLQKMTKVKQGFML